MKIRTLIILTLLIFSSCAKDKACEKFKEGSFKYSNPEFADWLVERKGNKQREINAKTGVEYHAAVKWNQNCSYQLTYTKVLNEKENDMVGKEIQVKITETNDEGYVCKSTLGEDEIELGMLRIK